MSGVQAWEILHSPECGQLTMVEFRDLMIRAGYPKEVVRKAAMRRGWDRLCAGQTI